MRIDQMEMMVTQAKAGERHALDALSRWFLADRQLFSCAYRILRKWEEDVYDVLQECVLKLWSQIHRYDPTKGPFTQWCQTMVRNAALDQLRRRCRERQHHTAASASVPLMPIPDPGAHAEEREISQLLDEAAENAGLSTRQQLIWHLTRAGYDVAAITGMVRPVDRKVLPATVSREIWRAKRKLSVYLWVHYPDIAHDYSQLSLIFDADASVGHELESGRVPPHLHQVAMAHGIELPRRVLAPNNHRGQMWLITGKDRPVFLARNEGERVGIYG